MTSQKTPRTPLLSTLTKEDLHFIIDDVKHIMDGGAIVYIIDASDLKDYCFPMGLDGDGLKNGDKYLKINQQLALDGLMFSGFLNSSVIVTKEYYQEIWNFKNTIIERARRGIRIVNHVNDLAKDIEKTIKSSGELKDELIREFIEKDYPLIASIKIGAFSQGYDSLIRLSTSSKLLFENNGKSKIIKDLRHFRYSDAWANKDIEAIFEIFELFDERSQENQMATLRDATSILLTQYLNNYYGPKTRYCYLSTQGKSKALFDKERDLGQSVNFRTSAHIFALLTAKRFHHGRKRMDLEGTLDVLEYLDVSFFDIDFANADALSSSGFSNQLRSYLDNYENWGVLAQDNLERFSQAETEIFSKHYGQSIQRVISQFSEYFTKHQNFNKIAEFEQNSSLFLINTIDEIIKFMDRDDIHEFLIGNDPIEAKSQILPISYRAAEYDKEFTELLQGLSKYILGEIEDWNQLSPKIVSFLDRGKTKSLPNLGFLLLCNVLVLLLNRSKKSTTELVRDNNDYIQIQRKISNMIDAEFNAEIDNFEVELDYVACWAFRRARLYEDSLAIAKKSMKSKDRKKDPRFYHGYFLTLYSIWHESSQNEDIGLHKFNEANELENIISYGIKAYGLYKEQLDLKSLSQVDRCLEALENSLAYLFAFVAQSQSGKVQSKNINSSESYLQLLKSRFRPKEWESFPEYCHTEAVLKLTKAIYFKQEMAMDRFDRAKHECLSILDNAIAYCKKNSRHRLLDRCETMRANVQSEFY